ncbi:Inosine-5'-monophosphate dehydrogenase [bacterium HR40]|nr:Inosine-5'-monophosphate dehydrogenase [bacterium HR40]
MPGTQTQVFRHRVRDHLAPPPVVVRPDDRAEDVVARMVEARASAAVVVDATGRILGILTEQDIVRRIACRRMGERTIDGFMTRPVLTVRDEDPLYVAIGFMRRHRLRHMPVTDLAGRLVGMLYLHEALAVAAGPLVADIDHLTHEDSFEGLRGVKAAQVQLAERLFADHVPAPEIQALVSDINNDLYRRVLRLTLGEMREAGWGEPPVAFCCIVMGSGGRGESFLFPDQDNGFILEDYPDERHTATDRWFVELAERMVRRLDAVGFPLCRGGVMAINPVWRKTLSQWKAQVTMWMRRLHETMLQMCDIFFDFRPVFGEFELARDLRTFVTEAAAANRAFLYQMFEEQAEHRAAVGLFGRFVTERDDPAHRGQVNLKYGGTLPLAEAVRLLALREGIPETSTLGRIAALERKGRIDRNQADYLENAYAFLTGLQLRQQIADYRAGRPAGNFIDPASLTEREADRLREYLKTINEFRSHVRAELTGRIL